MYIWIELGLLPKLLTCWSEPAGMAGLLLVAAGVELVVVTATLVALVVVVAAAVEVWPPPPLPGHPEPGVHWAYQGFWVLQQLPATQLVGPLYPIPPHCPQRFCCWAKALPARRARETRAEGILGTG